MWLKYTNYLINKTGAVMNNLQENAEDRAENVKRRLSFMQPIKISRLVQNHSKYLIVSSKYESLDYDAWVNEILVKEEQQKTYDDIVHTNILRWVLYFLVGFFTGLIAVFIELTVNIINHFRYGFVSNYINKCSSDLDLSSYVVWFVPFILPILLGILMIVLIEPNAAGSGIPYVISYLNGISVPKITTLRVLVAKIIAVILFCVAGLTGGKEGPLIHIGAIVGGVITNVLIRLKIPKMHRRIGQLNTVQEKRDLMAAGYAAGISAAFGSPVGATLLCLEENPSFWDGVLMWRIFFCSVISTFTFNTVMHVFHCGLGLIEQGNEAMYQSLTYFGQFNHLLNFSYADLALFVLIGIIGGITGAAFVVLTTKIAIFRLRFMNTPRLQVLDAVFVACATAAFTLGVIFLLPVCSNSKKNNETVVALKFSCPNDGYNEMSSFWLQSQEHNLKKLLIAPYGSFDFGVLCAYLALYFFLFTFTCGIKMPSGFFVPALLVGSIWGRLLGKMLLLVYPSMETPDIPSKFALLGAAAQLGGILRVTVGLTVIVIEASGCFLIGIPLVFTLCVTKWIGDFFTEGYGESQIYVLGIPILPPSPPPLVNDITAKDLMNTKVVLFPATVSVGRVLDVLQRVKHQGFPVVDKIPTERVIIENELKKFGELRGFIFRSQLLTLLLTKSFSPPETPEDVNRMLELFRRYEHSLILLQDIKLTENEKRLYLDLRPYMNASPYSVQVVMSFPRIFKLLRSLGLRHVIVVDNSNQVVGIITRKDLAKFRVWRHAVTMGVEELKIR